MELSEEQLKALFTRLNWGTTVIALDTSGSMGPEEIPELEPIGPVGPRNRHERRAALARRRRW